jgi:transposase
MANKRIRMNKLRQILRFKFQGASNTTISSRLRLSRTTVIRYLKLIEASGLNYEQLLALSDAELSSRFVPVTIHAPVVEDARYQLIREQFSYFETQLKKPGITRHYLWQQYRKQHPDGYGYSQFCYHFQQWLGQQKVSLHLEQKAGEKLYVDFCGKRLQVTDRLTGELHLVEVLVAVLGASQYTYVEAVSSQRKSDFIGAIERAFRYFGGVPKALVPDNLKSAVTKACRYEPLLNETFEDFATHYQTVILPARPLKPQDKSLVELAVNQVYRRIYAPLQDQVFFDLVSLNAAIANLLPAYNQTLFQGRSYSRQDLFTQIEQPALQPLPADKYLLRHFRYAKVQQNCHVLLSEDKHYYSVPCQYVGKAVRLAYSEQVVEVYSEYDRIALHERNLKAFGYTTHKEHLPAAHQFVLQWSPAYFTAWAAKVGSQTQAFITALLASKPHAEQAYKSCLGVLQLEKKVGKERLEKACRRALHYQNYTYRSVCYILERGLETLEVDTTTEMPLPHHDNIRGQSYYQ